MPKFGAYNYRNFGQFGEERGGQVLDTIAQLLGQASGVVKQNQEEKQKSDYAKALSKILGQNPKFSEIIPPETSQNVMPHTNAPTMSTDIPFVTKSSEQVASEMDPAYLEKILGVITPAKKTTTGSGNPLLDKANFAKAALKDTINNAFMLQAVNPEYDVNAAVEQALKDYQTATRGYLGAASIPAKGKDYAGAVR